MNHMIIDEADEMTGHGRPMPRGGGDLEAKFIEIRCLTDKGIYGTGATSIARHER